MSNLRRTLAAAALSLATLAPAGYAGAADMPVKAVKPPPDLPFFLVIDNRVTYSYIFSGTDPGVFSTQSEWLDQRQDRQSGLFVHAFRCLGVRHQLLHHLDVQVGSQRSGFAVHNAGVITDPLNGFLTVPANCAGATEIYGLFR